VFLLVLGEVAVGGEESETHLTLERLVICPESKHTTSGVELPRHGSSACPSGKEQALRAGGRGDKARARHLPRRCSHTYSAHSRGPGPPCGHTRVVFHIHDWPSSPACLP
jgi:hypothetical protein